MIAGSLKGTQMTQIDGICADAKNRGHRNAGFCALVPRICVNLFHLRDLRSTFDESLSHIRRAR